MKSSPSIPHQGKNVLLYHYSFRTELGGCDYLPLLLIAELQRRGCSVTLALYTGSGLELKHVSKQYKIDLDMQKVRILTIKPENKRLRKLDTFLPFCRTRILKKNAKHADICISTANMIDFGKPAHHVVYHLRRFGGNAFIDYFQHKKPLSGLPLFKRKMRTFLAQSFLYPALRLRSTRRILADQREHIYVPSRYVADIMRGFFGPFNCTLFYPPTIFDVPSLEIKRNPLKIIYLGWIRRGKCILEIIDIVKQTRKLSGRDVRLHLTGPMESDPYTEEIKQIAVNNPWIQMSSPVYGQDKAAFLLSGTYAIHAERDEAFGISVTEYLKAGVIPIVPDEGGTPEIVDNPALTYHTDEDAAHILIRLLTDEAFRQEQLDRCRERAKIFSFERYMETQHKFLDKILEETT